MTAKIVWTVGALLLAGMVCGQELQQGISVHDPVMIRQGDRYYLFCTGFGISVWSSDDMKNWKKEKPVFARAPGWTSDIVPEFKNHIWAPDISYFNGRYYLYYSVSAFGKNTSAIGLATNPTLDHGDPDFLWTDHGEVVRSVPGSTNWNAIDPNLIIDEKGHPWLAFGSFWEGLKLVRLREDGRRPAEDSRFLTIASRKTDLSVENLPATEDNPPDAGGNAIEAPFIFRKDGWFYLFASIDYCCKGPESTYKVIVGRSRRVQGPYADRDGIPLAAGGGSLIIQGDTSWYGAGHNAVCTFEGTDYIIFHGYDAADGGKPKLRIAKLKWEKQGWPEAELTD